MMDDQMTEEEQQQPEEHAEEHVHGENCNHDDGHAQAPAEGGQMLTCVACGEGFEFTDGERDFYQSKGFEPPKKCKPCRQAAKAQRGGGGGGGYGREPRQLFDVVCDSCGVQTQVPFQPQEGRDVYCRDCYRANAPGGY